MTKKGFKCVVIDKKNHVGGLCFSKKIEGIDCHSYGPHIFHTSKKEIWDYINSFIAFNDYRHRVKIVANDGNLYSFPFICGRNWLDCRFPIPFLFSCVCSA